MTVNEVDVDANAINGDGFESSASEGKEAEPSNELLDALPDSHDQLVDVEADDEMKLCAADVASSVNINESAAGEVVDDVKLTATQGRDRDHNCEPVSAVVENALADMLDDYVAAQASISRAQTNSSNDQHEACPKNNASSAINQSISIEEENFVAIELVEPTNIEEETRETSEERAVLLENDELQPQNTPPDKTATNTNPVNNIQPNPNNKVRKKLRHPLLTPLTKLPWDKIASAAGTCDLLFNCKYSMRQVEDEVREEKKTIQYDVHEDEEYVECDVEELGLHCCSMLEDSEDEGGERKKDAQADQQPQQQKQFEDRGNLLVEEEQKAKSWRGSNPTLDMMLYKQFLGE